MSVRDGILCAALFLLICFSLGGVLGAVLCLIDKHSHSHFGNREDFKPDPPSKLLVVAPPGPPPGCPGQWSLRGQSPITYKKPDSNSELTGK